MAQSAMAGVGPMSSAAPPVAAGHVLASPPRMAQRFAIAQPTHSGATFSGRSHGDRSDHISLRGPAPFSSQRLAPRRDLRSVSASSAQTRHFNLNFDPSKSNIPEEYNFVQPMSFDTVEVSGTPVGVADVGPYVEFDPAEGHPTKTYWRGPPPTGSFMVRNTYAQRTRLTPLHVPELGATGPRNPLARILSPFPREEYYAVEMELNYGREWPRFVWENGTFVFRPGFLQPAVDPDLPAYWLHRGIARFQISGLDQAVQTFVGALYLAALAALAALLYSVQPSLLAAVAVSWTRNTLSLSKWAALLVLAAVDRLYLYWVLLAAKLVDGVLATHVPPVRNFCWANLVLWGAYLTLSPADWTLLPGVLR